MNELKQDILWIFDSHCVDDNSGALLNNMNHVDLSNDYHDL